MKTRQVSEFKDTEIGKIPNDWEVKQLQEISKVVDSAHITPKYSPEGYSMVRVKDIKKGFLDLKESLKVSEDVYKEFTKNHTPKRNDIVMGRVGTYGIVSFVGTDTPFCLGQNTVVIHSEINHFIYHALNSKFIQKQIEERVGGSTQKTISLRDIRELLVLKPTKVEETNQIAKVLFDLEMKLENLQNQNKILEQITQTIFKSWFIDFDGVTEFEDSELGQIPKGWHVCNIEDFLSSKKGAIKIGPFGSQIKREYFVPEGFKVYGQENVMKKDFSIGDRCIPKERFEKLSSCELKSGELVISMMGNIGNIALVPKNIKKGIIDSHLLRLQVDNEKGNSKFLLYYLESPWIQQQIELFSVGTIMAGLNSKIIKELRFLNPGINLQTKFDHVVSSSYDKIFENNFQIRILLKIRDTLLPKLMSGEIRV